MEKEGQTIIGNFLELYICNLYMYIYVHRSLKYNLKRRNF